MMTHEEFVEKECHLCGTQRCYGVDYCGKYKKEVLGIEDEFTKAYKDYIAEYSDDVVITDVDDTDGDISDIEYEATAQGGYDSLVRSLIEAGGEIRELKETLREVKDALFYMLLLHDSTHGYNMQEVVPILYHLQSNNGWTVQKAQEIFKKTCEYCEEG